MEALRFLSVAVAGVLIDLAIAAAMASIFGLPLWLAASIGFVSAACLNYAAHELWTFRTAARQVSGYRAIQYLCASAITLLVRLGMILLLQFLGPALPSIAIFVAAAGTSLVVSFTISKVFVFSGSTTPQGPHHE